MDVILKKKKKRKMLWIVNHDQKQLIGNATHLFAFRVMWYCAKTKSIKNAKFRSTSASNDYNVWVTDWIEWCDIFFFQI